MQKLEVRLQKVSLWRKQFDHRSRVPHFYNLTSAFCNHSEIVLSSLETGVDLEELKLSYPFLTLAHLEAARAYEQEHPRAGTRVSSSRVPSAWKAKSRRVTRRAPKE